MAKRDKSEEVGNLFITEGQAVVKLEPSKVSGSRTIRWFSDGCVTNVHSAAKDIAFLVGKLQGKSRVVRKLIVSTDYGSKADLKKMGLVQAVEKAGFSLLN